MYPVYFNLLLVQVMGSMCVATSRSAMRGTSPTVREGSIMHLGALPNGRASAPSISNTLLPHTLVQSNRIRALNCALPVSAERNRKSQTECRTRSLSLPVL